MSNKNPFEIREDILAMAKDYMDTIWRTNLDFVHMMYQENKKTLDEVETAMRPYSMDELLNKAEEMYSFITKKD